MRTSLIACLVVIVLLSGCSSFTPAEKLPDYYQITALRGQTQEQQAADVKACTAVASEHGSATVGSVLTTGLLLGGDFERQKQFVNSLEARGSRAEYKRAP